MQFATNKARFASKKCNTPVSKQLQTSSKRGFGSTPSHCCVDDNETLDTNVVSVELGFLQQDVPMRVGDPILCSYCKSSLSHLDGIENNKWKCRFCGTENECEKILPEEIPDTPILDYVIEQALIEKPESDGIIVYCIDTSGSMAINIEVTHERKCFTRLDVVKNAICQQVCILKEKHPKQKVCIVRFSKDVKILGDCTKQPIIIKTELLNDYDGLIDIAKEKVQLDNINNTIQNILKSVQNMEEQGSTALGPALLISTIIASKEPNGQVILCTDGTSNCGLGNLEETNEVSQKFYQKIGELALQNGVVINVNTLKGCDTNMQIIGETAVKSSGEVMIVEPSQIGEAFNEALSNNLIATDVIISIFLHPAIYINNFSESEQPSRRRVVLGNVMDDSRYQFKYGLRPGEDIQQFGQMKNFPIQIQIEYKKKNGLKGVRVLTQTIDIADESEELQIDGQILQTFYIQQTAQMRHEGRTDEARRNLRQFQQAQQISFVPMQGIYREYAEEMESAMDQHNDYSSYIFQNATNTWNDKRASRFKKFSKK
ncbi:hypothetical protein, conserved [Entamoeba dispar SAW760]|uniref:VWFA domain-containing protein n=1 Tax=Entamoeba dispar (strain ATCC PRA-260 / SAW760) TaxID=370354 RepID=B0ETP1_ENTDS|nr:uncharacterized protein EDI_068330 [Entamoeba dispar SAW760]EDR22106.1 hypothetical protein, conserved [Entamoeba dispar SAW760]|eukprot:EDR22106.1 hypothetical protein, conserved [Entamoeba dispar SAW760]